MFQASMMMLGTLLSWAGFQFWIYMLGPFVGEYPNSPWGTKFMARVLFFFGGLLFILMSWLVFRTYAG